MLSGMRCAHSTKEIEIEIGHRAAPEEGNADEFVNILPQGNGRWHRHRADGEN